MARWRLIGLEEISIKHEDKCLIYYDEDLLYDIDYCPKCSRF